MIKWTRTNHRHALSSQYGLFIQLSRRQRWLHENTEVWKAVTWLRKTYGDEARREDVECPDGRTRYRYVPNEHWFIDRNRRRIYVKEEKTLTLMALVLG